MSRNQVEKRGADRTQRRIDQVAQYNRDQYQKRTVPMRFMLGVLKLAVGCVDCGYRKYPESLDFDHTSDDKVASLGLMGSWPLAKIIAELEKCEVVCSNCHRHRTVQRNQSNMRSQ